MPIWMMLAFLSVVGGLAYGLNSYALYRADLALNGFLSAVSFLKPLLVFLTIIYFVIGKWLTPRHPWVRLLAWCSGIWLGVLVYIALLAAVTHLGYWVGLFGPDGALWVFDVRLPAPWWIILALAVSAYGVLNASRQPRIRQVSIEIEKLPDALDGLRIVQLSDIHIGPTLGERFARQLTEATHKLKPDLVVMTGDLVDGVVPRLEADVAPFLELTAPLGVYFVTGNHELISGADPWVAHLKSRGMTVLENQGLALSYKGEVFNIAGVEDWDGAKFPSQRVPSLSKALAGLDMKNVTVLLAHQPKAAPQASTAGVDLQLSGHTHGGQLFPFSWLVRLDQPYCSGLYPVGQMRLYVSEGTGYWGPPMRVGTRSEMTLLTLTTPKQSSMAGLELKDANSDSERAEI